MRKHAMRCLLLRLALLLFVALTHQSPAISEEAAALLALQQGGAVALMRHTEAPGGAGDPPGFRLDDCATQRNLSEEGRENAKAIGARLKSKGIGFAKILSSPWCRCMDTATLLDMGEVVPSNAFSNIVVLHGERTTIIKNGRDLIETWSGPGTILVVTHGANIQALTGGRNPIQGEIVVVDRELREIGRVSSK
jgi:phosphohistidine phosphatase SixA